MLQTFFITLAVGIIAKSLLIGSEFSFYDWIKYGKTYSKWYFNRETFSQFIKRKNGSI